MVANVESMFSVKSVPWHRLGLVLDQAPNAAEAIKLAGLDWSVEKWPLFAAMPMAGGDILNADEFRATVRSTDRSILGVVGKGYEPVQNVEAFDFCDPLIKAGKITLETAGSLGGGRRVWVLAKVGTADVVAGDPVNQYLAVGRWETWDRGSRRWTWTPRQARGRVDRRGAGRAGRAAGGRAGGAPHLPDRTPAAPQHGPRRARRPSRSCRRAPSDDPRPGRARGHERLRALARSGLGLVRPHARGERPARGEAHRGPGGQARPEASGLGPARRAAPGGQAEDLAREQGPSGGSEALVTDPDKFYRPLTAVEVADARRWLASLSPERLDQIIGQAEREVADLAREERDERRWKDARETIPAPKEIP